MVVITLVGIVIITSIFWLPYLIIFVGIEAFGEGIARFLIYDIGIGKLLFYDLTWERSGSQNVIFTWLLLSAGGALLFRGFIIHRRHIRVSGFIVGFLFGLVVSFSIFENNILALIFAIPLGFIGAKAALTTEVVIAMVFGYLATSVIAAFVLSRAFSDSIIIFIGVIGAILGWRAHAAMIMWGTAATGAGLMTVITIGSSGPQNFAFRPLAVTVLFVYLLLTGVSIQAQFAERIFGPLDYISPSESASDSEAAPPPAESSTSLLPMKVFAVSTIAVLPFVSSIFALLISNLSLAGLAYWYVEQGKDTLESIGI